MVPGGTVNVPRPTTTNQGIVISVDVGFDRLTQTREPSARGTAAVPLGVIPINRSP